jgi:hypothetical protein
MNDSSKKNETELLLYGWFFPGDPQSVFERGKQSENQAMYPHYMIEVKTNIGPDVKLGLLYGYDAGKREYTSLRERNISGDILHKTIRESLGKNNYLYLKGFGVWKVDGLSVDSVSATIQISKDSRNNDT